MLCLYSTLGPKQPQFMFRNIGLNLCRVRKEKKYERRGVTYSAKETIFILSFSALFVVWPVAEVWRDEVCGGEWDGEEPLCEDDGSPEGEPGAPQLQEDHEVHALVLRLLQQGVDPTLTPPSHHHPLLPAAAKTGFLPNRRYVLAVIQRQLVFI